MDCVYLTVVFVNTSVKTLTDFLSQKIGLIIMNNSTFSPLLTTFTLHKRMEEVISSGKKRWRLWCIEARGKEKRKGEQGGNAGWRQQEDRKGKTQNRERIRGVSRPWEFTMHLDPISSALTKDNRTKARETMGGKGKTRTQQADVSSGLRLN